MTAKDRFFCTIIWKQCRSRSSGSLWSQLISIHTVFHSWLWIHISSKHYNSHFTLKCFVFKQASRLDKFFMLNSTFNCSWNIKCWKNKDFSCFKAQILYLSFNICEQRIFHAQLSMNSLEPQGQAYVYYCQMQGRCWCAWNSCSITKSSCGTLENTVKPVLSGHSKRRPKLGFQDQLLLNAGQNYCRML